MSIAASYRLRREKFALEADLSIPGRGITGLFGPSGSGKTTLLRCLAGLEQPTLGRLEVDSEVWQDTAASVDCKVNHRRVAYVFQDARLFRHLNVRRNLAYGQQRAAAPKKLAFDEVISLLGIEDLLDRSTVQLSGGEAQRVAIARALLSNPRLLLMDEPLASLDKAHREEILPFLDRLHAQLSLPIIYVSHSMEETCRLCDYLAVMQHGKIAAMGDIQELLVRMDVDALSSEESGAVIQAQVKNYDAQDRITQLNKGAVDFFLAGQVGQPGEELRLRVKAKDVSLSLQAAEDSTILNIAAATIDDIQDTDGPQVLVRLLLDEDKLLARISRRSLRKLNLHAGQRVYCQIKAVSVRATAAGEVPIKT